MVQTLATAVTWLFVPGDRPERFAKAAASGADLVVVDLEDAVAEPDKAGARTAVARWLVGEGATACQGGRVVVRVNGSHTGQHAADLDAVAGTGCAVMLPKVEDVAAAAAVADRIPGQRLVGLIETPRGVLAAADLLLELIAGGQHRQVTLPTKLVIGRTTDRVSGR